MNIHIILMIVFFLLTPVLVILLEQRFKIVKKIGGVLICYILGALVGNLGLLPGEA